MRGAKHAAAQRWDARCGAILQRLAGSHYDHEIAARIEAETGHRFAPRTVAAYRRAGQLPPCRRNDWTMPLKRARGERVRAPRESWQDGETPDEPGQEEPGQEEPGQEEPGQRDRACQGKPSSSPSPSPPGSSPRSLPS